MTKNEKILFDIRTARNVMLLNSDYTQLNDSPFNDTEKEAWADYRQELRDLPASNNDPSKILFPMEPS